jgi:acetyl esterase/lipase
MSIPHNDLIDPINFPIFAESFDKFPRFYMQVPGLDPLVGEGLLFERILRENGVETKLDYYPVR